VLLLLGWRCGPCSRATPSWRSPAFIAYGLLLSLVWVRLYGIDVALTEAAIGGGLTGALLLGAVGTAARHRGAALVPSAAASGTGGCSPLSVAVTTALALCVLALPDPAPTLAPQVAEQHLRRPASATRSPRCCWRSGRWTRCSKPSCC
jgi:hypothetical protein